MYNKIKGLLQTQATLLQVSLLGRFHVGHSLVPPSASLSGRGEGGGGEGERGVGGTSCPRD